MVYENGISAPTPSTVASLNHGGAWKNTIASAGFCNLAARQGFLEPFSTYQLKWQELIMGSKALTF